MANTTEAARLAEPGETTFRAHTIGTNADWNRLAPLWKERWARTEEAVLSALLSTQDGSEANGWRPIDEVERSGDVFLLYHPPVKSGRFWLGEMMSVGRPREKPMRPPSHYQPLPPAPALINPPTPGGPT